MNAWWEALSGLQKFFYLIAIPSTLILVLQFILSLFGLQDDSDFDTDYDVDADQAGFEGHADSIDFRFVSFRGIIAFLTIFGWVGVVLASSALAIPLIILIASVSGLIAMAVVALLFYSISQLQSSGNIQYNKALGNFAEVYIPIPAKNEGSGKVQIYLENRLVEADAITFTSNTFKTGEIVRVVDIFNQTTLVVEKEEV